MDSGGQVDAVFSDYSKAFDRIDHQMLLLKLLNAGIHGNLFRWFTSYIENRSQAVVVNGFSSSAWVRVPSGVPQGSLLGPLLFTIFLNDIGSCFVHSHFLLYADDMKVFKQISDINDCYLLQEDLNRFELYCLRNKLDLNVSKCFSITFTRKLKPTKCSYILKGTSLKQVDEIRDLGVIQDSMLLYDKHVDNIAKRANKALGFVIRASSQFSCIKVVKILYCTYVRSILEYCSQVWSPQYDIYINRIESIQRRFLRFIQFKCKCHDIDYDARCRRHHMLPLQKRRQIADIVFLSKIAQSRIDSPQLLANIKLKIPNRSARHTIRLEVPFSATNYRKNSFFSRAVVTYNNLVDIPELDLFNSKAHKIKKS